VESIDLLQPAETDWQPLVRQPDTEPIPGYRLIELLGKGGFGEVWKCEAPGGLFKAIKFVYGNLHDLDATRAPAEEELKAIQRVKSIRHPFILSMERVESIDGELAIVMELADKNLHDLLEECRAASRRGLPRDELLSYLREAAEALDLLNVQYGLQHLDIKPRNLFLISNHVKVGDFGLVNSLGGLAGGASASIQLGAITPLYASPEIFRGSISPHSDQYSLAIVYQELLTGTLPYTGKNSRQLLMAHAKSEPDLRPLPAADRLAVARALSKDPQQRFPSCTDFVRALITGQAQAPSETLPNDMAGISQAERRSNRPASSPEFDAEQASSAETDAAAADAEGGAGTNDALPGYRFLECLGCSPVAELWKVRAPDGRKRLIKFVYGLAQRDAEREWDALVRLKSLRYPGLLHIDVVRRDPGRLILATDVVRKSLANRLQECLSEGQPGIPRRALLGYLRAAAEALDYLYEQHALQHLGLNPRNLFVDNERLLIAEFGLLQLLYQPAGQLTSQLTPRYAAPELFKDQVSRSCDQYSLAVLFHDLLTGARGTKGKPDVERLPTADRPIVARALDADPQKRWPTCSDFIRALEEAGRTAETEKPRATAAAEAAASARPRNPTITISSPHQVITELITTVGGGTSLPEPRGISELPAEGDYLLRTFQAPLPLGTARSKLEEFRRQCNGHIVRGEEDELVFKVVRPRNIWQQCLGRQPGLEVHLKLSRPRGPSATPIQVSVQIKPFGCTAARAAELLKEMAPMLVDSIRTSLQVDAEKRTQERLLWNHVLQVRPIFADGKRGDAIECQGKDISLNGIGFYVPHALPTTEVWIELPANEHTPAVSVPASIVRVQRRGDGFYDVGALFLNTAIVPA
jgi:serine/threonine protein kinase